MPTTLEITPRRIKGTYAGYSAATYGNDIYACTDKPIVFIFGQKYNCHKDLTNNPNHSVIREVLLNLSAGGVSITTKGNNTIDGTEFSKTSNLIIGSNSIKLALNASNNLYLDVVRDPDSESFFTSGAKGLKVSGIQAAINSAKGTIDNYTINGLKVSSNPILGSINILLGPDSQWNFTSQYLDPNSSVGLNLHLLDNNIKANANSILANTGSLKKAIKVLDSTKANAAETDFTAISTALTALGTGYKDLVSIANTLKTFLESKDTTDATINRWQEIQTFLAGVTDTQTLTGLLASQKTEIMNTMQPYITKLNGIESGANKYVLPVANNEVIGGVKTHKDKRYLNNFRLRMDDNQVAYVIVDPVSSSLDGLMTPTMLAKLNGIEEGANNYTYTLPTAASGVLGGVKIANDKRYLNNFYLRMDNNQVAFVVVDPVSTSLDGLMTKEDKVKLNGIATGANNYSLPTASSTTKGGVKLGYTNNGKNYKVEIDANGNLYVNVPWVDTNTTYSAATTTSNGLMTADMVVKLNGIATNANNYSLPTASDTVKGGIKTGSTHFQRSDGNFGVKMDGNERAYVTLPVVDSSGRGMMSPEMLTKLNGIATGANNYSLPTASSSTKGGIKVGSGLSMNGEVLSVNTSSLPTASSTGNGLMSSSDKRLLDYYNSSRGAYLEIENRGVELSDTVITIGKIYPGSLDDLESVSIDIPAATTSDAGVMSSFDKRLLDYYDSSRSAYLEVYLDYHSDFVILGSTYDGSIGSTLNRREVELSAATSTDAGLMSASDKVKLDSLPNIVEVSSLPSSPDPNTLYLVS